MNGITLRTEIFIPHCFDRVCFFIQRKFKFIKFSGISFSELLNRMNPTLFRSFVTMSVCFAGEFGQIQNFNRGSEMFFSIGLRFVQTKHK